MEHIAYIAGLFDGEGCVKSRRDGRNLGVVIALYAPEELFDLLQETYGGTLVRYHACPIWSLFGIYTKQFLTDILPFSIVKRPQIEVALQLLKSYDTKFTTGGRSKALPTHVIEERTSLAKELARLKTVRH